jgi:hypothetical protein
LESKGRGNKGNMAMEPHGWALVIRAGLAGLYGLALACIFRIKIYGVALACIFRIKIS